MEKKTTTPSTEEVTPGEQAEQGERTYAEYANGDTGFDPTKELNLPTSYDEVTARFKRLQGNRDMEVLN